MRNNMSGRGFASVARATAAAVALCFAVAPAMAEDQPSTNASLKVQSAQAAPPAGETAGPAAKGPSKEFTEDDVNAAVKKTVDERSKGGVFVFHDPKLDQDLNL